MELYQLQYFDQAAQSESITKAAQELHITQPALSKAISKLEDELSVKLFERSGRKLLINEQGKLFHTCVKRVLADLDDGTEAVRRSTSDSEGRVSIGIFGADGEALECIVAFMKANPRIGIDIETTRDTANKYAVREYDILFYPAGGSFTDLEGIPYGQCMPTIALPEGHPLEHEQKLDLSLFKNDPFVFANITKRMYEKGYRLCAESGFYPMVRAVANSIEVQIKFVRNGIGVGLVFGLSPNTSFDGVTLIRLEESCDQVLCFSARPTERLLPAAKRFYDFAMHYFDIKLK